MHQKERVKLNKYEDFRFTFYNNRFYSSYYHVNKRKER